MNIERADSYQDFFNFLSQEHNLICTIEEMDEIIHEAQIFVKKFDINIATERYHKDSLMKFGNYWYVCFLSSGGDYRKVSDGFKSKAEADTERKLLNAL
jgi:hypothetical protein